MKKMCWTSVGLSLAFCLLFCAAANGQGKKPEPLTVSYASITGTRAPLWIAKELGLFEKYGIDVNLVYIASGSTSVSALLGGSVHLIAASGSSTIAAASQGAPLVIVGSSGPIAYRLIAHPSITSIEGLRGKIIGSSRIGAGSDYALRRLLPKLGLNPDKDVRLIPTGLSESDRRLQIMLQGKIDATLGTADNIVQLELRGQKVSVLADLLERGVFTTGSDIATNRQFLKEHPTRIKAFLMAFSEGTWIGRSNKEQAFRVFRKYMKAEEPRLLESMHKNYLLGTIPLKPFPNEEALQNDIDELSNNYSQLKGKKTAEFLDTSLLRELEKEEFFTKIHR